MRIAFRHPRRTGTAGTALVLLLLAAGCTGGNEAPLACPRPAIINGLQSLERHAGGGGGPLAYRAALENIGGSCAAVGGDLLINLSVDVVVEPGPAAPGGVVEVPYFIAVSSPTGDVVDRQDFIARIELPRGTRRAGSSEKFTQRFVGLGTGAPGYRVLAGFALPPGEALEQRQNR